MSKGGGGGIPNPWELKVGGNGSVINVDADLDNIHAFVEKLPRIEISLEKIPKVEAAASVAVTQLPQINLAVKELPPVTANVNLAITEVPEQRVQMPANFHVGFSLLGMEVFRISLCGESQIINEKYVPRAAERGCS